MNDTPAAPDHKTKKQVPCHSDRRNGDHRNTDPTSTNDFQRGYTAEWCRESKATLRLSGDAPPVLVVGAEYTGM